MGSTTYRLISLSFLSVSPSILGIRLFHNLTLKVQDQDHSSMWHSRLHPLTSLSFHINRPSHSWDADFFLIWPLKFKVNVMGEVKVQSHKLGPTFRLLIDSHPFCSMSIVHPTPGIQLFQNFTLKIQDQGHCSMSHSESNIVSTNIPFVPC